MSIPIALFLKVHGRVQGVGYRWFVASSAKRIGIKGMVRNAEDGSVEVLAIGGEKALERFISEINVDLKQGPSVMNIEKKRINNDDIILGKPVKSYIKFTIEK